MCLVLMDGISSIYEVITSSWLIQIPESPLVMNFLGWLVVSKSIVLIIILAVQIRLCVESRLSSVLTEPFSTLIGHMLALPLYLGDVTQN